jgi:Mitochondrial genome maintenance MGM101
MFTNFASANTTTSIMATSIPRAARSVLSRASSVNSFKAVRSDISAATASRPLSPVSRSFSTSHRFAATAAPTYARKNVEPAKVAPPPSKQDSIDDQSPIKDMTNGLADEPLILDEGSRQVDWTRSYHGLSSQAFSKEAADTLLAPIPFDDVEVKPDGIIYLPEIKYRRILNKAFGPGGWGLAPRGETIVTGKSVTREYALVANGRYVFPFHLRRQKLISFYLQVGIRCTRRTRLFLARRHTNCDRGL